MERLKDRVAIVTGGAQGIGYQTALQFVQEGAKTYIWDVQEEKGQKAAGEVGATFQKVNTTSMDEVQQAVDKIKEESGRIDILINNAGITRDTSFKKMTGDQWQQVIDVNLTGVFNCCKAVVPIMNDQKYGRIVNASSVIGVQGNFGQVNYASTKSGLFGFTKSLAREVGRKNITVNCIAPGYIETDMIATVPEENLQKLRSANLLQRLGKPQDIANAYVFLASEEASYITSVILSVDGGQIVE
jgi:3-oxoacyl-[acyl-carrier protein] reductase